MMDKKMTKDEVRDYFDKCAPTWDERTIRDDDVIEKILDNAGVHDGTDILDVACGTGALFGDYLERNVAHVTAIDISPEMVKYAKMNYNDSRIDVICGDVEEYKPDRLYDVCMLYNAFPHFADPQLLIRVLSEMVKPGGHLSIAHGMSREQLKEHHKGEVMKITRNLPDTDVLADMMSEFIDVDCQVSDETMYQVAGIRRADVPDEGEKNRDMSSKAKTIDMKGRGDLTAASEKLGNDTTCAHEKDEELARSYDELAKSYMDTEEDVPEHSHDHEHPHDHSGAHHTHKHDHQKTKQVMNRLAKASGHLEKVKRMVEKGEDCTDVLIQLSAVIAALKKTGKVILEDHIQNCIVDAVRVGDEKAIEDLKNAIDRFLK